MYSGAPQVQKVLSAHLVDLACLLDPGMWNNVRTARRPRQSCFLGDILVGDGARGVLMGTLGYRRSSDACLQARRLENQSSQNETA